MFGNQNMGIADKLSRVGLAAVALVLGGMALSTYPFVAVLCLFLAAVAILVP